MTVRRIAAIVLMSLVVSASPASAGEEGGYAIAIGSTALLGFSCWIADVASDSEEVDAYEYARPGWLLGIGGTYGIERVSDKVWRDLQTNVTSSASADNSLGIQVRGGRRCHPRFSTEVQVEWMEGFDLALTPAGGGAVLRGEFETLLTTANVKGYLLTGRYQPYILAGAGIIGVDSALSSTTAGNLREEDWTGAFRFGAGIDIYATKNLVVNVGADYVLPLGGLTHIEFISIGWGLEYRF